MNPCSSHPALVLLHSLAGAGAHSAATFQQVHAHFLTAGLALHSYPLSRLLLLSARPPFSSSLPPSYSVSILFHSPRPPSTFLFNTLISSCSPPLAFHLFSLLSSPSSPIKPNSHTFPSLLKAASKSRLWAPYGLAIQTNLMKFGADLMADCFVATSLVNLYAKLGKISVCRNLFDRMPEPDLAAWNSIISAYARCCVGARGFGESAEALVLFNDMLLSGVRPNETTMVAVIGVCGDLGALVQGAWAHAYVGRRGLGMNRFVGTALIDMYSRCGRLDLAEQVFDEMDEKDTPCYNAMIRGLATHGHAKWALCLFEEMQSKRVEVDDATVVVVMCACAHAGLVDEGRWCFNSMEVKFGIAPKVEHYGCLVDLLARQGQVEEAEQVLRTMPMKPNPGMYRSLLGACRINNKQLIGDSSTGELIAMEPDHGGNYVLLSNIFASLNRWEDVCRVRKMMKDRDIDKNPGSSLVEVSGAMHEFVTGDRLHPNSEEIYAMLGEIGSRLHEFGHRPSTKEVFFDVEEEDKEDVLSCHSEKLAIAFALVASETLAPITIIKNLRVCGDCHSSIKLISLIYKREIIMRDRIRFHHFREGACSCSDYW